MTLPNAQTPPQAFSIHPATRIGQVSLTVANLENQLVFYQRALGFKLHWRDGNEAGLGAGGADLLHLQERPGFKRYQRVTGLYHLAVLFPNQRELAVAVGRLFALRYPNAPTDHILTKTTYLDDPEGNTVELYAESPEDGTWSMQGGQFNARRADGTPSDGREPLDLEALFAHLSDDDKLDAPLPAEARIGHVHLFTSHLGKAVDFYSGVLGFDLMGRTDAMQMAFVSAGGYHHHVGLNTWVGAGAPPPPPDALGLRHFEVLLPSAEARDAVVARVQAAGLAVEHAEGGLLVRDPFKNGVLLNIAP